MNNWTAAEILLGAAVLVLAMPREDGFLIPERRDWLGWARRILPSVRRRREEEGAREADRYVTDLRAEPDQDPMLIRRDQLPSARRRYVTPLLTQPTEEQAAHRPPWKTAENPAWGAPQEAPPGRRRRAPGDPPTIVIELMRPGIADDLGRYLAELPAYPEAGEPGDALPVPRSSLAPASPESGEEDAPGGEGKGGDG